MGAKNADVGVTKMAGILQFALAGAGLAAVAGIAYAQEEHYGIPNGHMPPPGECRVWYPGVPAGQQPPPTSCATAERQADRNGGRVIYGGRDGRYDDRWHDRRKLEDRRDWEDRRDKRRYRDNAYRQDYRSSGIADFQNDRLLRGWALRNFDADRDGRLSRREAREATAAFQNYADSDRNGRVTQLEYRRARAVLGRR